MCPRIDALVVKYERWLWLVIAISLIGFGVAVALVTRMPP
jgi:uncharacterized membrane protein YczE